MRIESRRATILVSTLVMQLAAAVVASAQSTGQAPTPADAPRALITPFFAIGDDLAPGAGGVFNFPWTRQLSIEAEASLGTDAARSSVSMLYALPRWGGVAIYVAGGGGVQRDEVARTPYLPGVAAPKETEFALNVGAGVTVPASERWGYRFDFRWYRPEGGVARKLARVQRDHVRRRPVNRGWGAPSGASLT